MSLETFAAEMLGHAIRFGVHGSALKNRHAGTRACKLVFLLLGWWQ